jgi:16S rRNA (guanine527-N7)-methyltransferase
MARRGGESDPTQANPVAPPAGWTSAPAGDGERAAIPEETIEEAAAVTRELAAAGLPVSESHVAILAAYLHRVRDRGQRINLVSSGDLARLGHRHLLESFNVLSCSLEPSLGPLADAGSGAGFPGLPLALLLPDLQVLLIESVRKKARFLQEVVGELGVTARVRVAAERIEVLAARSDLAGAFNTVTARGLGPLARVVPWCAPLLSRKGHLVAFKGTGVEDELRDALGTISSHGMELADIIPMRWGDGRLVILRRRR